MSDVNDLFSPETEKSILGALLLDSDQIYNLDVLTVDHFALDSHRRIFRGILAILSDGEPVDLLSLSARLSANNELEKVGGVSYLSCLSDGVPMRMNCTHHAARLVELHTRRQFNRMCEAAATTAFEMNDDITVSIAKAHEQMLALLSSGNGKSRPQRVNEFTGDYYAKMQRLSQRESKLIGIRTGNAELDDMTTGWRDGELIIYGGYTKDGKTAFALQTVRSNLEIEIPIGLFSQEMDKNAVISRMIPAITNGRITGSMVRDPRRMNTSQMRDFMETKAVVDGWPLWVDDASSLEISEMVSRIRYLVRKQKIRAAVVDYLQLIKVSNAQTRVDQIRIASSGLREVAKSEGIPVIALSQLSRPEGKIKRMPTMFDFRDSGNIEQDAHCAVCVYREEKEGKFTRNDTIAVVAQREGPRGPIDAEFDEFTLTWKSRGGSAKGGEYASDYLFEQAR